MDQALTEIDIANTQVNSLSDAQPVARDQTQDGVVPFPNQRRPIWCGKQPLNVFPRNRMGESIQLARQENRYGVDQISRQQSLYVGKPQNAAQRRNQMLTGRTRKRLARRDDVVVHRIGQEPMQVGNRAALSECAQKRLHVQTAQNQRSVREPLRVFEKVQVLFQERIDCRDVRTWDSIV